MKTKPSETMRDEMSKIVASVAVNGSLCNWATDQLLKLFKDQVLEIIGQDEKEESIIKNLDASMEKKISIVDTIKRNHVRAEQRQRLEEVVKG